MSQIAGLHGHIRRNTRTTWLIIGGFFLAVCLCWMLACTTVFTVGGWWTGADEFTGTFSSQRHFDDEVIPKKAMHSSLAMTGVQYALDSMYVPLFLMVVWFAYFWFNNRRLMNRAMGSRALSRLEDPRLYKLLENLSIQVGQPMPAIEVIDSPALNAYAHGWSPATATIGVTRGLLDTLPTRELEAVMAHEYTHILNRDSRVMLVATMFCGIFEGLFNHFMSGITGAHERRADGSMPLGKALHRITLLPVTVPLFGSLCVCFSACWLPTLIGRAVIARSREFLADAGAVELTKDADALVSALRRLAGADCKVDVPPQYQAMMIFGIARGLLASHPSVEERITALRSHAGAVAVEPRRPARLPVPVRAKPVAATEPRAQFGRRPSAKSAGRTAG